MGSAALLPLKRDIPLRLTGSGEPEFCKPRPEVWGLASVAWGSVLFGANQKQSAGSAQEALKSAVIPFHLLLSAASKNKGVKGLWCWTSLKASVCRERGRLCVCISPYLLLLRP